MFGVKKSLWIALGSIMGCARTDASISYRWIAVAAALLTATSPPLFGSRSREDGVQENMFARLLFLSTWGTEYLGLLDLVYRLEGGEGVCMSTLLEWRRSERLSVSRLLCGVVKRASSQAYDLSFRDEASSEEAEGNARDPPLFYAALLHHCLGVLHNVM